VRVCSFCQKTAEQIKKEEGLLISMKAKPEVGVCNTCNDLMKSGAVDNEDVNSPTYKKREYIKLLGDDDDA